MRKLEIGNDIWLIGVGKLNATLLQAGLIDEFMVFVMPIVLGSGISLFGEQDALMNELKLVATKTYQSGAILLHYKT